MDTTTGQWARGGLDRYFEISRRGSTLGRTIKGKVRQVHPLLWAVTVLFVLYCCRGPLLS
jgi:hypothetical protein